MKAEVRKLDINKVVNVPTSLDNLKLKVDNLDVGELKTVPVLLKKYILMLLKTKNSTHYKQKQITMKRKILMQLH